MPANPKTTATLELNAVDNATPVIRRVSSASDGLLASYAKLSSVLAGLGLGLGVGYFAHVVKGAIDAQDEISKLSQKVGISVEALAGYQHAAQLAGVGNESLTKGFKSLSSQMFDASSGLLESQRNFKSLGIEVKNTGGGLRSTEDVMLDVADKFAGMQDGAAKSALAVKLFGKAGMDMIPMLNEGSGAIAAMVAEGQKLNPVTSESAKQAEIFNDNMERLEKSLGAVGIRMMNDVLPFLSKISEIFAADALPAGIEDAQKKTDKLMESFNPFVETLRAVTVLGGNVAFVFKAIGIEIGGIAAQITRFATGDFKGAIAIGKMMKEDAAKARADFDAWERMVMRAGKPSAGSEFDSDIFNFMGGKPNKSSPAIAGAAKDLDSAYRGLVKTLKEKLLVDRELTEVNKLQLSLDALSVENRAAITPAREKELRDLAERVDLMKREKDALENLVKNEDALEKQRREGREMTAEAQKVQDDALVAAYKSAEQIQFETSLIGQSNEARELAIALREIELSQITREGAEREKIVARMTAEITARQNAQREADLRRKSVEAADAVRQREVEEWARVWGEVESTGRTVWQIMTAGGENMAKSVGKAIKASIVDMLYQLAARPIILQIGAGIAGSLGMATAAQAASGMGGMGAFNLASMGNTVSGWLGGPSIGSMLFGSGAAIEGLGGAYGTAAALGELGSIAGAAGSGLTATGAASAGIGSLQAAMGAIPGAGWAALAAAAAMAIFSEGGGPKASDAFLRRGANGQFGVEMNNVAGGDPDMAKVLALNAALNDPTQFDPAALARLVGTQVSTGSPADTGTLLSQLAAALQPAADSASQLATQAQAAADALQAMQQSISTALDAQITATKAAASAAQQTATTFRQISMSLQDSANSLRVGDLSPLAPLDQLNTARDLLNTVFSRSLGGDATALQKLPSVATDFLNASRAYNASSIAYAQDFKVVLTMLGQAQQVSNLVVDVQDQIAAIQTHQVEILGEIKEEVSKPHPDPQVLSLLSEQLVTGQAQADGLQSTLDSQLANVRATFDASLAINTAAVGSGSVAQLAALGVSTSTTVAALTAGADATVGAMNTSSGALAAAIVTTNAALDASIKATGVSAATHADEITAQLAAGTEQLAGLLQQLIDLQRTSAYSSAKGLSDASYNAFYDAVASAGIAGTPARATDIQGQLDLTAWWSANLGQASAAAIQAALGPLVQFSTQGPATLSAMLGLPSHADGLTRVPYDNYLAYLHRDERVLTAREARSYGSNGGSDPELKQALARVSRDLAEVTIALKTASRDQVAAVMESVGRLDRNVNGLRSEVRAIEGRK